MCLHFFFFFKQKTAYEMRISDWSSDVCSSDLFQLARFADDAAEHLDFHRENGLAGICQFDPSNGPAPRRFHLDDHRRHPRRFGRDGRSEEHTSELQSLMRTSYAVFCLKKKTNHHRRDNDTHDPTYHIITHH